MSELAAVLWLLGGFLLLLFLLAWFSRAISIIVQELVFVLTRSTDAATVAIFLLFVPGVLVHEAAHWLMARLLGLRTGKFRVWPRRSGRHIGLGSVSVESRNSLVDSLVGIAPLLAGTVLVAGIANWVFAAHTLVTTLTQDGPRAALQAFAVALERPDAALWAYLLFTIANAMMPSASDREPMTPVLTYAVTFAALYILLGMPVGFLADAMLWAMPALQSLTAGLLFTVLLDLGVLAVLWFLRLLFLRNAAGAPPKSNRAPR